jgi:hypothetical protein
MGGDPRSRCHLYLDAPGTTPALCHRDVMPMHGWTGLWALRRRITLARAVFRVRQWNLEEVADGEILQLAEPVRRRCWRLNARRRAGSSHAFAIDTGLVRVMPNGDCMSPDELARNRDGSSQIYVTLPHTALSIPLNCLADKGYSATPPPSQLELGFDG